MNFSKKINLQYHLYGWLIVLWCLGLPQKCEAHGDLHERIQETTQEIQTFPDSAFLYFKRGKLFFHHEDFQKAISDLEEAAELGLQGEYCNLIFAQSYQKLENFNKALFYIEKILKPSPHNVTALKIKAQILFNQKKYTKAGIVFESVIQYARWTLPENYLDASKAWELANRPNKAIAIVEKGIEDLSPLFVFQDRMKTLFIKNNDFKRAINIQNEIIDSANRKEFAYQEAANICLHFKKNQQAKTYLKLSLASIAQLPPRIQSTKIIIELKHQLNVQLRNT